MTEGDSWFSGGKRKSLKWTCGWGVRFIKEGADSLALYLVPSHTPVLVIPHHIEHGGSSCGLPVGLVAGIYHDQGPGVAGMLPISIKAFHKTFYCIFSPAFPFLLVIEY